MKNAPAPSCPRQGAVFIRIDQIPAGHSPWSTGSATTRIPEVTNRCIFSDLPTFCLGPKEDVPWTIESWSKDQEAAVYNKMTARWAEIRQLFQKNPWGSEGPEGPNARMAFMAVYNVDRFRAFVFDSSFLKRFKIKSATVRKIRTDDAALLAIGFDWIKLFVWGLPSKKIRPR